MPFKCSWGSEDWPCLSMHQDVGHLPELTLSQYGLARMEDPNVQPQAGSILQLVHE